jgi:hypothetical protein
VCFEDIFEECAKGEEDMWHNHLMIIFIVGFSCELVTRYCYFIVFV